MFPSNSDQRSFNLESLSEQLATREDSASYGEQSISKMDLDSLHHGSQILEDGTDCHFENWRHEEEIRLLDCL